MKHTVLVLAAIAASAVPAAAQKSADTLRVTMRDALTNIDPYYNNLRTGVVMHHQGWDALIYRNPDTFKLEPLLATEWKQPDPTTIEFTLRPGVKFHDGSPFTADDVVYTINLIADPASRLSTPANYNWLDKAEKTGDLSVRVKLKRPTPAALEYFALVIPIYPKAYREKVGAEGYAKAEVTVGGIDTRDLSSKTMEARSVPGLYVIGEAVDVTGWLGGYNFQWAWSSGWCAGQALGAQAISP